MKHTLFLAALLLVPAIACAQTASETTVLNSQFQQVPASQLTIRLPSGTVSTLGAAIAAGGSSGISNATATSIPTTGTGVQGTVVNNSAPSEQGTAGAKFVTIGWICLAAGTPGTWVPLNVFDGN